MGWKVKLHEKAKKELYECDEALKDEFLGLFKRIRQDGLLSLPQKYRKHVEDRIWELRVTWKDGIARSLYVTEKEQTVRVLVIFVKKTEKTPREKIALAKKRIGE